MKSILLLVIILIGQVIFAQQELPVIKATSDIADVRDGNVLNKGFWKISPKIKPDIYKTECKNTTVTFYTDIDSISFLVEPGLEYSYIILLNNKDSALTQIIYAPGFLDVLKNAYLYDYSDTREINKFTYKPMDDTGLMEIRRTFKLDSVAGEGNEISKIINLMHWVHDTYPHDGTKEVSEYNSVLDLMITCRNEHLTLNCGALANVMNNCYLSMGFKSRRVVCLPKDSNDVDCHSINAVYSNTLNKWLWIDPTNDAYIMNEKGELLGISEVRERLINDMPIILNPAANWNHKSSITKEEYLYKYMAKNLYALQCFISGAGESKSNLLLPLEYNGIIPRTIINKPKCTNNPNVFWEKPE
ncbi:MAG: transglutaminase domain-containing protein [Bacteroidetes bacterium]|nr:transglutaminase domain-containing protein [Bacteroidota bacterium]